MTDQAESIPVTTTASGMDISANLSLEEEPTSSLQQHTANGDEPVCSFYDDVTPTSRLTESLDPHVYEQSEAQDVNEQTSAMDNREIQTGVEGSVEKTKEQTKSEHVFPSEGDTPKETEPVVSLQDVITHVVAGDSSTSKKSDSESEGRRDSPNTYTTRPVPHTVREKSGVNDVTTEGADVTDGPANSKISAFKGRVSPAISKMDIESSEPEVCVELLRTPSIKTYAAFARRMKREQSGWMERFLDVGGIEVGYLHLLLCIYIPKFTRTDNRIL